MKIIPVDDQLAGSQNALIGLARGSACFTEAVDQAMVDHAEALVAEQDRLTTCFFCLIGGASTCALGLTSCPWRDDRRGDFTAVQPELSSERRSL